MTVGLEVTRAAHRSRRHAQRVVVRGELDLATAGVLREHLDQILDDGGALALVDASGMTFVDSSGLRCLVLASDEYERHGARLVIDHMSPVLARLLEMTGLIDRYRDGAASNGANRTGHDGSAL